MRWRNLVVLLVVCGSMCPVAAHGPGESDPGAGAKAQQRTPRQTRRVVPKPQRQVAEPAQDQASEPIHAEISVTPGSNDGDVAEPMRISMSLQDVPLKQVFRAFSQQTGINLIAGEDIGEQTLTLFFDDVTVMDALDQILEAANLMYERPIGSQIYIVKPKPELVEGEEPVDVTTRIYRLKFARVSASRLAKAAEAFGVITPFESANSGGGTPGGGGAAAGGGAAGAAGEGIGIDRVIQQLLTTDGRVLVDPRTNSLIISDVPDNFARIDGVLNALDIKTPQLLIEAEVLETTLTKLKDLGIEWGSGSEGTLLTMTPAGRSTTFPFSLLSSGKQAVVESGKSAVTGVGDFTRSGQISLGVVDASSINMALQALERDTDTKVLARPKILTLDNESAVIRLTSQQAVALRTTTVAQTSTVAVTPERMTTGVILTVTPQVNEDGYITMLVEPSVTKVVASQISSDVVDPKTRSARAMVRVRRGETLVMGGLIDRTEEESIQRVPVLSGIPFLGEAFKNKENDVSASELIVFLTPTVLAESFDPQVAAAGSPPLTVHEQEPSPSRQEQIEETLTDLEHSTL